MSGFVFGFVACLLFLTTCEARAGGGEIEPQIPNCDMIQDGAEYEACVVYVAELLMEQQIQQQQFAIAPDFATPNQPTTIVVDGGGGSSIAEWGALATGVAALIGALAALRARRHRAPD